MSEKQHWQKLFPESYIALALEILITAGKGLRKKNSLEHEDNVSERLIQRIELDSKFKKSNLGVDFQFHVPTHSNLDSTQRSIPDFAFRLSPKRFPYFAIEAKRLRFMQPNGEFKTGNSDYVYSDQGMLCFTDDRYSVDLDAGAMLGYVYDGEIDSAKQGISKLIEKHAQLLKCKKPYALAASKLLIAGRGVDETIHALDGRDFRIFHIFLAV